MSLPPSSPRLPSPPPAAEIPKSPSGGPAVSPLTSPQEQTQLDTSSKRRIHPGTKASDMAAGPPLIPFHELDSAFQLQEHLAALHCHHTASNTEPITRQTALQLAQPPPGVDRTIWLYELCRFLISQCNSLIIGFLFDTPPCSASTCPEMRASEWQFLCAVHEQPKSCCAIDYCCHTLDWAANVVTDQKIFPSRFVVHSDNHSKNVGVKNLVNVFRRLHRIFAHAWFQHRGVFWTVEGQTGLYVLFKTVCDLYDLLPAENYKLPPEAEGLEAPPVEQHDADKHVSAILKPPSQQRGPPPEDDSMHPMRTNTRRHIRSSPSTGSAVTTVIEAEEDEPDGVSRKLKNLQISAPSPVEEEPEVADVPVIVEQSVVEQSPLQDQSTNHSSDDEGADENDAEASDADQTVVEVVSESDSAYEHDNDASTDNSAQVPDSSDERKEGVPEEAPEEAPEADVSKEDPTVKNPSTGQEGQEELSTTTDSEKAPDAPSIDDGKTPKEDSPKVEALSKMEAKEDEK